MAKIKYSGGSAANDQARGLAIQMTKEAREASLIEESDDGDVTYRAPLRVYAFNHFFVFVDRNEVDDRYIAEIVSSAAKDTDSIYCAANTRVQPRGNGYQSQLPSIEETGLTEGDEVSLHTAEGVVCASKMKGPGSSQSARLAEDITQLRKEQTVGANGDAKVESIGSLE